MRTDEAFFGQRIACVACLDQEREHGLGTGHTPHCAARHENVVTTFESEVAVVTEQVAAPLVNEQQLVAIRIANQVIHCTARAPETNPYRSVEEDFC